MKTSRVEAIIITLTTQNVYHQYALDDTTLGISLCMHVRIWTAFVVEKGFPGFALGQRLHGKAGMRASMTAELVFDDCAVPVTNRLGEEGDSLLHMMRNLEIERVTLAAMSTGIAGRCVEVMTRYANERTAFGQTLNAFGQIQRYIADSYAQYMAARTYLYHTAVRMDLHKPGQRVDSDGVKLVATMMAKQVADNAMQVLGSYGYWENMSLSVCGATPSCWRLAVALWRRTRKISLRI
jgi:alkylation response protein AidB-like acyl-CoA dehydrogenase